MKSTVSFLIAVFIALAAADYQHAGGHHAGGHHAGGLYPVVQPGPAQVLTYPGKVPLPPCATVYLLSCSKSSQQVPCGGAEHGEHYVPEAVPYPHAAPAHHHEPAPAYKPAPAPYHHAPAPAPAKY
ncbi:inactive histone-lysine N-methyltransferase 2E-like [Armigeres subalbatus]|uniref:inactive histone-lysine N-methyltransferase 2E-like n=1 Tax=Armigeres subalbatus TaxID=124917 RepID=UPI002ED499C8